MSSEKIIHVTATEYLAIYPIFSPYQYELNRLKQKEDRQFSRNLQERSQNKVPFLFSIDLAEIFGSETVEHMLVDLFLLLLRK